MNTTQKTLLQYHNCTITLHYICVILKGHCICSTVYDRITDIIVPFDVFFCQLHLYDNETDYSLLQ